MNKKAKDILLGTLFSWTTFWIRQLPGVLLISTWYCITPSNEFGTWQSMSEAMDIKAVTTVICICFMICLFDFQSHSISYLSVLTNILLIFSRFWLYVDADAYALFQVTCFSISIILGNLQCLFGKSVQWSGVHSIYFCFLIPLSVVCVGCHCPRCVQMCSEKDGHMRRAACKMMAV